MRDQMTGEAAGGPGGGRGATGHDTDPQALDPEVIRLATGPVPSGSAVLPSAVQEPEGRGEVSLRSLVTTLESTPGSARNPRLEALWFQLNEPRFLPTVFVPVPAVTSEETLDLVNALATVAASISRSPIAVVNALGLTPSQAVSVSAEFKSLEGAPSFIVADAPTVNTGAIPILRSCPRSVLVVGLTRSRADEVEHIVEEIGGDRVFGSVCLEEEPAGRWWRRR